MPSMEDGWLLRGYSVLYLDPIQTIQSDRPIMGRCSVSDNGLSSA